MFGLVPSLEGLPRRNADGRWQPGQKKDFPCGYHLQVGGGFCMPAIGNLSPLASIADGYGSKLKADMRRTSLTIIALAWRTAEFLAEQMRTGNV